MELIQYRQAATRCAYTRLGARLRVFVPRSRSVGQCRFLTIPRRFASIRRGRPIVPGLIVVVALFALSAQFIYYATDTSTGAAIFFGVLAALLLVPALAGCYLILTWRKRAGTVTADSIVVPKGFLRRRKGVVPLDSVAAVGLVFDRSGWVSFVWLEDGQAVQIPAPIRGGRAKDADDWNTLASTKAGATCIAILDRARRLQGPSGPVALDHNTARLGNEPKMVSRLRKYWPANRSVAYPPEP